MSTPQHGHVQHRADVLVAGAGLTGMITALACARAGFSVILAGGRASGGDGRASALAASTGWMLMRLGALPALAPVCAMSVWGGPPQAAALSRRLHFGPDDADGPLAWMVENRHLQEALAAAVGGQDAITWHPGSVMDVRPRATGLDATLAAEGLQALAQARVCIAADGRASPRRTQAAMAVTGWDYGQDALTLTVAQEKDHDGVARQYFLPPGPFAILPLPERRAAVVWTMPRAQARRLLRSSQAHFAHRLQECFGTHAGAVRPHSACARYPLELRLALDYVRPRLALVGEAAHVIHPLAGMGFNLAARDAAALAQVLAQARALGLDVGDLAVLQRYQRWRRFDNVALALATDALNRGFSRPAGPLRTAWAMGLGIVDGAGPLKRLLARAVAGSGRVPALMRPPDGGSGQLGAGRADSPASAGAARSPAHGAGPS